MVKLCDASVTNGAMLRSDWPTKETSAAKSSTRRVKVVPVTPLGQVDDRTKPLLFGHGDDSGITSPALPEVVPEQTREAQINGGRERTHVSLKLDVTRR